MVAAGSALVGAMATDAWGQVRAATVAVWHRIRPEQADDIDAQLQRLRTQTLAVREDESDGAGEELVAVWSARLHLLFQHDPSVAAELLRRLLEEELNPRLPQAGPDPRRDGRDHSRHSVCVNAHGRDNVKIFQSGGDQHISGA
ncbi:hypothetical protein [Streptomyces sp. NPDC020141]|uniref:hypothetical protein n=1 Tax=Streptomyces sp. NPDC020141 TaxID=3365065 RepID=UPI0037B43573